MSADFDQAIAAAYATQGAALDLGRGVLDGAVHRDAAVRVPLATLNRHGLIAGATGTGKTKTLQVMTEQLSAAGVPVFVADVKGDVSGLSVAPAMRPWRLSVASGTRTAASRWTAPPSTPRPRSSAAPSVA